eukprot:SAG11_NODE_7126_length_1189_cov_1.466055_2_plen_63_part_00
MRAQGSASASPLCLTPFGVYMRLSLTLVTENCKEDWLVPRQNDKTKSYYDKRNILDISTIDH